MTFKDPVKILIFMGYVKLLNLEGPSEIFLLNGLSSFCYLLLHCLAAVSKKSAVPQPSIAFFPFHPMISFVIILDFFYFISETSVIKSLCLLTFVRIYQRYSRVAKSHRPKKRVHTLKFFGGHCIKLNQECL